MNGSSGNSSANSNNNSNNNNNNKNFSKRGNFSSSPNNQPARPLTNRFSNGINRNKVNGKPIDNRKNRNNQYSKNNSQQLNNKNEFVQAKQNLIKEGVKTAAGPAAGKLVEEASKTKLGKKALNNTTNKFKNPFKKIFGSKNVDEQESEEEVSGSGEFSVELGRKIITFFSTSIVSVSGCFTAIVIVSIICLVMTPLFYINEIIDAVGDALSDLGQSLGNLLTNNSNCTGDECSEEAKNNFYNNIDETYEKYKKEPYYVELNTNLITATLTYYNPFTTDSGTDGESEYLEPSNYINFKKSAEKVELLASKMVSICCYENGSEYNDADGNHMCKSSNGQNYDDMVYKCPTTDIVDEETGEVIKHYEEKYKLDIERYREYLEDDFIKMFYFDNKENENVDKSAKRITDEIFLRVSAYENFNDHKKYGKVYAYCSGVTVMNQDGTVKGTYDLEEYVAGVVSGEAWGGQSMEAYKAQAIAVRTYTLSRTNNCTVAIENSQSDQVFNENIKDYARQATEETSGMVLVYNNEIFSSEYDSYCYNDSDCTYGEENGKRYVIYSKKPDMETHKVYLSPEYYHMIAGGHGRGMSQVVSYEMADNGSTFDEILKFFYSDGVEIVSMNTIVGEYSSSSEIPTTVDDIKERSDYYATLGIVYIGGQLIDLSRIYDSNANNLGQCVWYARSSALEIILSSNMDDIAKVTALNAILSVVANGEGWFDYSSLNVFDKSTDINMPMPGAIISWSSDTDLGARHNYGHVAIIESVDYENKTVVMSEGWNAGGANGAPTWSNVRVTKTTKTFDQLRSYDTGYTFNGYVYILGKGE